jgi:hypothetical protein
MAEITPFPVPPRRFRVIEPGGCGAVLPFPLHASKRRWDQLLRQHITSALHERLERQRRWEDDQQPDW